MLGTQMLKNYLPTFVLSFALAVSPVGSQVPKASETVDMLLRISKGDAVCERFDPGEPVEAAKPVYPPNALAARIGGAVRVTALVAKNGRVEEIIETEGPAELRDSAVTALVKTRFARSVCDGEAVPTIALAVYRFEPVPLQDVYVARQNVEQFTDVDRESPSYEPLVSLTDNYRIAFGYADGKFHPEMPLTKGDLSHFLRLTLDLLQKRAELANKIPREIELYFPLNSSGIRSAQDIPDLDQSKPYAESVAFLVSKYDIALTDEGNRLNAMEPVKVNQLIDYWEKVFGADAVPVNFVKVSDDERVINRGEFALFLHESLFVLTYKVLP